MRYFQKPSNYAAFNLDGWYNRGSLVFAIHRSIVSEKKRGGEVTKDAS